MPRTRRNNNGSVSAKIAHKIHSDGKAIASVEKAVANLKDTVHATRGDARTGKAELKKAAASIPYLLGTVEEQEAAWLLAVSDPENFAARVPVSQVTGLVPVDLFRLSSVYETVTNAANQAYAMFQPDAWHQRISGALYYSHLLHADAASSTYGTCTNNSYTPGYFPVPGALPVGTLACLIGDVSADITSDANDGTEYLMVGCKHSLRAKEVASAAADAQFSGRVTAFYTADSERYPIAATAHNVLQQQAREEDAMVFMRQYLITQSGLFVPLDSPDVDPIAEISTVSLPLTTDSYEWQRVGASPLALPANVAANADVGFFIEAPANTRFEIESSYLWQVERYGDNRVVSKGFAGDDVYASANQGGHLSSGQPGWYDANPPTMSIGGMPHNLAVKPGKTPVPVTTTPPRQKRLDRPERRNASHRGGVPAALTALARAVAPSPGHPIHPVLPALAVTSAAASQPGIHMMMAQNPNSIRNITPGKVASFAVQHGPAAVTRMAEVTKKPGWTWKDLLKGAWDVAKVVGPAVAGLLL